MNTRFLRRACGALALAAAVAGLAPAALAQGTSITDEARAFTPADEAGRYRYIVKLEGAGLVERGVLPAKGQAERSAAFVAARSELQSIQASVVDQATSLLGRSVTPSHRFLVQANGLALRLTPQEARRIAALDGVVAIQRERQYQLDVYRGPDFIGADSLWDGSASPDGSALRGEGMIVAVLDSGINTDHPSFANDAACGFGTGGVPDKLLSAVDCSATDGTGRCAGPTPEDTNGHGTHVASTAAGNLIDETVSPAPDIPAPFNEMSGVAPCAHIRAYKVCPGSSCPGADITAGLATLLLDGDADTMNYSISGGRNPWFDFDRTKLDLVDAGIFVAASAGNTRPPAFDRIGEVNHLGPWVMSVAASTHDALQGHGVSVDGGPQDVPGVGGTGPDITTALTAPLRWAGDVDAANVEGCSPFAGGSFSGNAALISRGSCNFADKVDNATAAGASFVVVYNNRLGPPITMGGLETTTIPGVMVSQANGQDMITALGGGTAQADVTADVLAYTDPANGDVLADFSLLGPTPAPLENLQKPNITAPGVSIYAAHLDANGGYAFLGGTSMSSPHVAGAATLVRQAQPDWSPMEVKTALQMTATGANGVKDDFSGNWDWDDVGSGRVDLTAAALAGLLMDESVANFLDADPGSGGDVRTLNLPSVRDMNCSPDCTFTRTVSAGQPFPTAWSITTSGTGMDISVTPTSFSLDGRTDFLFADGMEAVGIPTPVNEQELTITVSNVTSGGDIQFGEVILTEDGGLAPPARITAAAAN